MKTAICVLIKDENEYLDEWLSHHFNLGIDEIFLYEDYGSKSHLDIVQPYGNKVHLNSIDVMFNSDDERKIVTEKGKRVQVLLFDYFPKKYKDEFDWILFIDIDEFLILKKPLHELLEEYNDKEAIYLRWIWYGASGHIKKPEGKVVDNFKKSITTTFNWGLNFKSFINCKLFKKWERTIHKAEGGVYPISEYGDHKAFIRHYFTKSWEEWKTKLLSRGDTLPGHRKIEEFFEINPDMLHLKKELMDEVEERYKDEKKKRKNKKV